jgi:hypothetical protein
VKIFGNAKGLAKIASEQRFNTEKLTHAAVYYKARQERQQKFILIAKSSHV